MLGELLLKLCSSELTAELAFTEILRRKYAPIAVNKAYRNGVIALSTHRGRFRRRVEGYNSRQGKHIAGAP